MGLSLPFRWTRTGTRKRTRCARRRSSAVGWRCSAGRTPCDWPRLAFPDNDGRVAGLGGKVGEGYTLLEPQSLRENHHAAVGIDDPGMGLRAGTLSGGFVPLQAHRNAGVHTPAAASFRGLPRDILRFTYFCGHSSL